MLKQKQKYLYTILGDIFGGISLLKVTVYEQIGL